MNNQKLNNEIQIDYKNNPTAVKNIIEQGEKAINALKKIQQDNSLKKEIKQNPVLKMKYKELLKELSIDKNTNHYSIQNLITNLARFKKSEQKNEIRGTIIPAKIKLLSEKVKDTTLFIEKINNNTVLRISNATKQAFNKLLSWEEYTPSSKKIKKQTKPTQRVEIITSSESETKKRREALEKRLTKWYKLIKAFHNKSYKDILNISQPNTLRNEAIITTKFDISEKIYPLQRKLNSDPLNPQNLTEIEEELNILKETSDAKRCMSAYTTYIGQKNNSKKMSLSEITTKEIEKTLKTPIKRAQTKEKINKKETIALTEIKDPQSNKITISKEIYEKLNRKNKIIIQQALFIVNKDNKEILDFDEKYKDITEKSSIFNNIPNEINKIKKDSTDKNDKQLIKTFISKNKNYSTYVWEVLETGAKLQHVLSTIQKIQPNNKKNIRKLADISLNIEQIIIDLVAKQKIITIQRDRLNTFIQDNNDKPVIQKLQIVNKELNQNIARRLNRVKESEIKTNLSEEFIETPLEKIEIAYQTLDNSKKLNNELINKINKNKNMQNIYIHLKRIKFALSSKDISLNDNSMIIIPKNNLHQIHHSQINLEKEYSILKEAGYNQTAIKIKTLSDNLFNNYIEPAMKTTV